MRFTKSRLDRLAGTMAEQSLDALVAFSTDNVAYCAGYVVPSQKLGIRNRRFASVVTADKKSALILTSNEKSEAVARSAITNLYPYDEFKDDPVEVLRQVLIDLGVQSGKVGLELDAMPADMWIRLGEVLPNLVPLPAKPVFDSARMIKTDSEIIDLRRAAEIACMSQIESYETFSKGTTEQDAYRKITDNVLRRGADEILMIQVAAGERSTFSNPTPGEIAFESGDAVKVDVFPYINGYLSDTGRSFFVDQISSEQREIWKNINETLVLLREMATPGTSTKELWEVFIQEFAKRDLKPAMRFLGHGLGLSLHEEPFIAQHSDTVLEPGMVFAVEPVVEYEGVGYHIEDVLLVTADGNENLTPWYSEHPVVV